METGKPPGRTSGLQLGLVVLTTISLLVCPLAWGAQATIQVAFAGQPFTTLVPVQATFTPPVGSPMPSPIPIPTLGPGQYFEQGDSNRPKVDPNSIVGDAGFGYGRLAENLDLYVIWTTDEDGTHYLTVHKDSEILSGGSDPDGGFFNLVRERESILEGIELAVANQSTERAASERFGWGALGVVGLGIVCVVLTGGTCLAFAGVAGGALWLSLSKDTEVDLIENQLESDREVLGEVEGNLGFVFSVGQVTEAAP